MPKKILDPVIPGGPPKNLRFTAINASNKLRFLIGICNSPSFFRARPSNLAGRGDPPHYPLIPEIGEPATSLGLYWASEAGQKSKPQSLG